MLINESIIQSIELVFDDIIKDLEDLKNKSDNEYIENFNIILTKFDKISNNYELLLISSYESIGNKITKAILAIIDYIYDKIRRIFNLYLVTIFKILQLSELEDYTSKNITTIKYCLSLPYTKVYNILVPNNPSTIDNPYNSILYIIDIYKKFNIINKTKEYKSIIHELLNLLNGEHYNEFDDIIKKYSKEFNNYKNDYKKIDNIFNPFIRQIPFGKLFNSMEQFKEYYNFTLKNKEIIYNTNEIKKSIEDITSTIEDFINNIKDNPNFKVQNIKEFSKSLKSLGTFVLNLSKYYDNIGRIIKLYTQHEHHICVIFEILKKID